MGQSSARSPITQNFRVHLPDVDSAPPRPHTVLDVFQEIVFQPPWQSPFVGFQWCISSSRVVCVTTKKPHPSSTSAHNLRTTLLCFWAFLKGRCDIVYRYQQADPDLECTACTESSPHPVQLRKQLVAECRRIQREYWGFTPKSGWKVKPRIRCDQRKDRDNSVWERSLSTRSWQGEILTCLFE